MRSFGAAYPAIQALKEVEIGEMRADEQDHWKD
jgi:hypothetical protein